MTRLRSIVLGRFNIRFEGFARFLGDSAIWSSCDSELKPFNLQCVVEGFLSSIPLLLGLQVIHFPDLRLSGSRPGRELLSGGSSPPW